MFGSNVLDVAMGLAFFYLLLSLLVTGINELLETKLTRRAKDLEAGIYELLEGETDSTTPPPTWCDLFMGIFPKNLRWLGTLLYWPTWLIVRWFVDIERYSRDSNIASVSHNLPPASASHNQSPVDANTYVEKFYNHPLIYSLFSGKYVPRGRNLPSYIPSQMFALALLDLVRRGVTSQDTLEFSHSSAQLPVPLNEFSIPPAGYSHSQPGDANLVIQLRFDIAHTNAISERTRQILLALIDDARGDFSEAQKNIEDWFNHAMDRVTGWYKRRMQWITVVIGLILAVSLNADSFAVANSLARDPVQRAAVTAAAEAYVRVNSPQPPPPATESAPPASAKGATGRSTELTPASAKGATGRSTELTPASAKGATGRSTELTPATTTEKPDEKVSTNQKSQSKGPDHTINGLSNQIANLEAYGWPLGWNLDDPRSVPLPKEPCSPKSWFRCLGAWLLKALGWVVTVFAISLGAPFWFDLLNKIIQLRSSLKPKSAGDPVSTPSK